MKRIVAYFSVIALVSLQSFKVIAEEFNIYDQPPSNIDQRPVDSRTVKCLGSLVFIFTSKIIPVNYAIECGLWQVDDPL